MHLCPRPARRAQEMGELSPAAMRDAQRHADSCVECARKVWQYRQLVKGCSKPMVPERAGDHLAQTK